MTVNIYRPRALLILFGAAILAAGLLALVGAKPAWAESRSFVSAPNSPFPVGSTPTTVTNADLNGDGKMDLAAQNFHSNSVTVLLGNGDGTFPTQRNPTTQDFQVGSGPTSVISADFNADGIPDLAVANQNSNNVSVLLGEDLNGDGKGDVGQDSDGDGTLDGFKTAQSFPIAPDCPGTLCPLQTMAAPNQVITADFNGDNKADLATANLGLRDPVFGAINNPGGVSVLVGNGDGTFQPPKEAMKSTSISVSSITAARLDAGTSVDLVATKFYHSDQSGNFADGRFVSVLRGNGDGTFQAAQDLGVGLNPSAVTSADLDGDAKADDLAVANYGSNNVSVLFNNDSGGFQAAQNVPAAGLGPAFVVSADFNADRFADLAVANQNSNNVSVLLNTAPPSPAPETTITSGPSEGQVVNSTSATFEFTSSEPGSTFQCALDNPSAYSPCTSPKTVPDVGFFLGEGSHTFYVKATGAAGTNTDLTPATRTWTVDTTAPAAPVISSPPEGGLVGASFTVSGTAEANSTVQLSEGATSKGSATASSTGNWSIVLSGVTQGSHTYKAKATDRADNLSAESAARTVTVDTTKPTVLSTTPPNLATGVARGISPTATFSEKMNARTIKATTFKLFRVNPDRSTTQITNVVVTLSSDGLKATLNPFGTTTTVLAQNTKYKAVVTTGAKDLAGNSLAQQKSWTFTTR